MSTEQVLDRNGHLTELAQERLAAELRDRIPDEEPAFIALAREHHDACAPCQDEVAALSLPMLIPRLRAPRPRARPLLFGAFALAATLFIAVMVTRPSSNDTRLKGGTFDFEAQAANGRVLSDNAEVHAGDAITFAVRVSETAWVAIYGVDAHDQRYVIRAPARLEPTSIATRLPEAIELDGDGDHETIVARACPVAFEIEAPVAADCSTRSITLLKR